MIENPYKYLGPLMPDEDDLVCDPRSADTDIIINGLQKNDYFVIYGSRQSGKTTFLRQIIRRFPHAHFVYISCEVLPDNESHFYEWLIDVIKQKIPSVPIRRRDKKWDNFGPEYRFLEFLKTFKPKEDKKIILQFDEVEKLPFLRDFLHLWRKIYSESAYKSDLYRYSIIFTSSRNLVLETIGPTSPFNIAKSIYLRDLSEEQSAKLIEKPFLEINIKIEAQAKKKLISQLAGHPQLLQHACYYLVNITSAEKRVIEEKDIDDAVNYLLLYNTTIDMLKQDIQDKQLKRLILDILNGKKIHFHPFAEFSINGAGCIVNDGNGFCTIRNGIYKKLLKDSLDIPSSNFFVRLLRALPGIFFKKPDRKIASKTPQAVNGYEEKTLKAIPYGVGKYEDMSQYNYYYVDKTGYLEHIEKAGRYIFFIRPRRFGKTLFISMMEAYYDIYKKNQFEKLFKGTDIFENPTGERNSYLILKFDFSAVASSMTQVQDSFLNHVKNTAEYFVSKYKELLKVDAEDTIKELKTQKGINNLLDDLLSLCKNARQKVYVIIDEYDNFANTILSTAGRSDYEKITHGEGFFRDFFKVIKKETAADSDSPIVRMFMTGVSPITLDDVTSSFNIAENITIDKTFNEMMGFREHEVIEMIEYYKNAGKIRHETGYILNLLSRWYNHYRFSKDSTIEVFNSTLVLYFLKEYFKNQKIPDELFDRNVRLDYGKLRHLIMIDKKGTRKSNGNFSKLKAVIEDGFVSSKIEKGFPLNRLESPENFSSLLFYFGLLTIHSPAEKGEKLKLTIPNEAVKRLFYEYISEAYNETEVFSLDLEKYYELMENMAYNGEWKPLLDYITQRMNESLSLRDLITGEKSIQAFLHVYLGLSNLYIIHSEKELNKGYADLTMEPFTAKYEGIKYSYLIEIKYINSSDRIDKKKVEQKKVEAENQLKQYSMDEKFKKSIEKTTLIKLALVFSGHRLVYDGEVNNK